MSVAHPSMRSKPNLCHSFWHCAALACMLHPARLTSCPMGGVCPTPLTTHFPAEEEMDTLLPCHTSGTHITFSSWHEHVHVGQGDVAAGVGCTARHELLLQQGHQQPAVPVLADLHTKKQKERQGHAGWAHSWARAPAAAGTIQPAVKSSNGL
eukprot:1043691-Pelagomonas_calceolata.AAC.2